jgi:hypothetical protein
VGEEPEETDSVRCVVPKEPGLVRVDWFELPLIPHEDFFEKIDFRDTKSHPKKRDTRGYKGVAGRRVAAQARSDATGRGEAREGEGEISDSIDGRVGRDVRSSSGLRQARRMGLLGSEM